MSTQGKGKGDDDEGDAGGEGGAGGGGKIILAFKKYLFEPPSAKGRKMQQ